MGIWLGTKSDGSFSLGPVLLLVLIVALPTAVVLWLTSEAMQNEQLAVRQRLTEVYQQHLETARLHVANSWQQRLDELDSIAGDRPPAEVFALCVRDGLVDSVVVFGPDEDGDYPALAPQAVQSSSAGATSWLEAERLEFVLQNPTGAIEAYRLLRQTTPDDFLAARALQGQVRVLLTSGRDVEAIELLKSSVDDKRVKGAMSPNGRLLWSDLVLLLAQKTRDAQPDTARDAAQSLARRLNDYAAPRLSSAQRRFAMHRLREDFAELVEFPTLAAEDLAAEYLERSTSQTTPPELQSSGLVGVWQVTSPQRRVLALVRDDTLARVLDEPVHVETEPPGVKLSIVRPNQGAIEEEFLSLPIAASLPGWRVAMSLSGNDPLSAHASNRRGLYLWTAAVTILGTGALAVVVAEAVRRQLRLARLKNDLVAIVSHELKTPLSAMRVLVDTLLDAPDVPNQTRRDYLELVAQEHSRLSRLIDQFLTFSRLERGRQTLELEPIEPNRVVRQAVEAMQDRLREPGCQFEARVEENLPDVRGNADSLVTVLVNLLDNAHKYSNSHKQITLRAFAADGRVCFSVSDNGLGLTTRHKRRVFERFYQVDQQLSRASGGCGLGLSIVQRIVDAHRGSIRVDSRPGQGSTFTVILPATANGDGTWHKV